MIKTAEKFAINKAAFPFLQVTNAASGISNGVVMITVPWLVLERTGSPAQAGLLAALVSLPGIFVSPVIGGLIDRVGRRAVSALSDIFSCASVLLFVVGEPVTELNFIFIASFAVLGAVFDPAGYTARKALIPNAAESSGMAVDKANGRHEGFFAIGWMLGGVALFGVGTIVLGSTTSFVVALVVLFLMGAGDMISVYVRHLLVQYETPDEIRGRVSAVNSVFIGASNELGEFRAGSSAALLGAVPAAVAGGLCTLAVVGLWTRLFPSLWRALRTSP